MAESGSQGTWIDRPEGPVMATIAFDVYGTLIDTDGVVSRLREWIGSQADVFSTNLAKQAARVFISAGAYAAL